MKKTIIAAAALLASGCLATSGDPIDSYEHPGSALVLIDLQRDLLEAGGKLPVEQAQVPPLLGAVEALHAAARARGRPVVRIENLYGEFDVGNLFRNGATVRGTPGAAWDPRAPSDAEAVFSKDAPDAFSNPAFDMDLRERQIDHVVLAGVYADGCVKWTARGALNRGYRVTLLRPAVAAGTDEARRQALEELRAEGVEVLDSLEAVSW
jgi:nicotinamidase-related amidase